MEYTLSSFATCMFNPLEKNITTKYPRLSTLQLSDENLLRFILLMYDPASPLIRDFRDLPMRQQTAAALAGFSLETDEAILAELFTYQIEEVVTATDIFLKEFVHIRLWSMICANEQTFYEYAERLMLPIAKMSGKGDKDILQATAIKSKLSEDMDAIYNRLDGYYAKMYDDSALKDKVQRKRITPETMGRLS